MTPTPRTALLAAALLGTSLASGNASAAEGDSAQLAYVRAATADLPEAVVRVTPISDELRKEYDIDPFYKKVAVIDGFPIIGSDKVSDYAFLEAAYVVDHMLRGLDKIKLALLKNKVKLGIIAATEYTMDIPENQNRWMQERAAYNDRRSRGLGGRELATCGEENLLSLRGDPYNRENITIHEFSHTIASNLRREDPAWYEKLEELYKQAMDEKLWANSYAATNEQEYWAEGTQSWFDCNTPTDDGRVHNGVWNREKLKEYDPRLAAFLAETYGESEWRYSKTTARDADGAKHLAGINRDELPEFDFEKSPRIIADRAAGGSGGRGEGRGGRGNREGRRREREQAAAGGQSEDQ
jgi:alpha-glucosidase